MSLGAMDGIARDVIEGFGMLPRRSLEVGGLLLGRVTRGARPAVWIERYQRIACQHRFGPQFVLDQNDMAALEEAAGGILENGKIAIVGIYRSHGRSGFQLEESDFNLIQRYFSDPSDLVLLIRPENATDLIGKFHAWDPRGEARAVGGEFPFQGRVVTPETIPSIVRATAEEPATDRKAVDQQEDTGITSRNGKAPAPRETPRRLIPDFEPVPVEPAPSLFGLAGRPTRPDAGQTNPSQINPGQINPDHAYWQPPEDPAEEPGFGERLKKWLPLVAALLLVGATGWYLLQSGRLATFISGSAQTAGTTRPIGLYVDTVSPIWRVFWNPNATALHDARSVQLFVREGDDQNRIELSARDLASGSYQYQPVGNDVTFRLEVVDHAGQVSAESFRLMRTAPAAAIPPAGIPPVEVPPLGVPATTETTAPSTPALSGVTPEAQDEAASRIVPPKAIYRAPPVVASGVRPRIDGVVGIDVRVQIDARGHVVSAKSVTKQTTGLQQYLAGRAVAAARLWRFEPARDHGKAVATTETIHFVFEK
jgi:hypothetical protein